jgi:uncharacterized protein YyaL (SSP411 family)
VTRLGDATSPYLQQHKDNPVDWWQWSPEAFEEARRRDVPVLISIGYAACHWCHVMAHESFEDDEVAAVVNAATVPIKVDREERPDVDAVYMTATQAMTGQGGWPMTVFATPDGDPFLCGTYFPRDNFVKLVTAVSEAWRDQRDSVLRQGAAVVEVVGGSRLRPGEGSVSAQTLDAAATALLGDYDSIHGGFGGAPKFPPHMALLFLLRNYQRTGNERVLEVVRHTCEAMARGGMYDQLAGGFARYSVDERWLVPHFEKMLYDNALLLRVYTLLWRLSGDALAGRVAAEVADFLVRDLLVGEAFAASLDADTAGVEGLTYAWTPAQLVEVLGEEDGAWAADLFDVTAEGTFEHGTSVLRLARDMDAVESADLERWRGVRAKLLAARVRRPQPTRDDKVVAAWNGLAVTALAEFALTAGTAATAGPESLSGVKARGFARYAAGVLADLHIVDGRLRRVSRDGAVGAPAGVLEDYGCTAEAFCAVHQLTGEGRWLELAGSLLDTALARFTDGEGGFFDTADDAEALVVRPADPTDNATPSGLSALVAALVAYSALSGEPSYRDAAELALQTVVPVIERHPRYAGYSAATAEALVSGPFEVAIVDPEGGDSALAKAAWRHAPPGAVIVAGESNLPGVPLLARRRLLDGRPTAYVCRGFVCDRPVTSEDELIAQLSV